MTALSAFKLLCSRLSASLSSSTGFIR
jgi:hypothetical protein